MRKFMLISQHLNTYRQAILSLPKHKAWRREELLTDDLLMARSGKLEVYYAPHNEYFNPLARIMIIGLTPGFAQMRMAIQAVKAALEKGLCVEEACRQAKEKARFAGSMRSNLMDMLDAINLHKYLNISSSSELFHAQQSLLHTTSMLRFPVFMNKKNYSGAHPGLMSSQMLKKAALAYVEEEIQLTNAALIIPLGKTVESALNILINEGKLDENRCLWGFPHPSGANGHRHKQFALHKERMRNKLTEIQW